MDNYSFDGKCPSACDRIYNYYETFHKSKDVSCYIQSIKNIDKLLATIHNYLTEKHSKFSMMYFSDHGLSFANKNNINEFRLMHENEYKQILKCYFSLHLMIQKNLY
ncbi:MAG: sulfatase-like hydrolase/transferase [Candidatus Phlomobacter fragariae]